MMIHGRMSGLDVDDLTGVFRDRMREHIKAGDAALIPLTPDGMKVAADQLFTGSGQGLADRVGPVYSAADTHRLLDVDRRGAADRRQRATILALKTSDGAWVYPTFQFAGRKVDERFKSLFKAFADVHETPWWTVAAWFRTERSDLGGQTPADWIRSGEDVEVVKTLARGLVWRWNQ